MGEYYQNESLENILEFSSDLIFRIRQDGIIGKVNATVKVLLGYDKEEIIGTNWLEFIHPKDKASAALLLLDAQREAIATNSNIRFLSKSGQPVSLNWSVNRDNYTAWFTCLGCKNNQNIPESVFNEIQESTCSGLIAILNVEGQFVFVCNSVQKILGYDPDKLLGLTFFNFIHPDDLPGIKLLLAKSNQKEQINFKEYRFRAVTGEWVWLQLIINNNFQNTGTQHLMVHTIDKSGRLNADNQLQDSEDKYHSIINNSLHSFLLTIPEHGKILEANSTAVKMFGYSLEELKTMGRQDLIDHTDPQFISLLEERKITGKTSGEAIGIRKNRERFPCEFSSVIFKDRNGENRSSILLSDITTRKSSETQLKRSERHFKALIEHADDIILLVNAKGDIVYVSPAYERITGFTASEVIGKPGTTVLGPNQGENLKGFIQQLLQNPGIPFAKTNKLLTKKGYSVDVEGTIINLLQDEDVNAIVSNYRDISARLEAEAKIKQSEADFRAVFNNAVEGFVMLDPDGIIKTFNAKAKEYFSYNVHEGQLEIGRKIVDYIEPDWKKNFLTLFEKVLQGEVIAYDKDYVQADGNLFWLHFILNPVFTSGIITNICITSTDITTRKNTEELLLVNEKRFRALVENGNDAVVVFTDDFRIKYVSSSINKVLGYSEEELMQMDVTSIILPEEIEEYHNVLSKVMQTPGVPIAGRTGKMRHKDGSWRWIEATLTNLLQDPAVNGIIDNFRDVTERVEANIALQQNRAQLQKVLDATLDVICTIDAEGKFLQVNQATNQVLGYQPEEILGKYLPELVFPEDLAFTNAAFYQIKAGENMHNFENRFVRKDGSVVPITWSARWDAEAKAIFAIARDATEKKKAEELLQISEKRFRALVENQFDGVAILSAEGKPIYISPAISNLLGYLEEDVKQMHIASIIHPDDFAALQQMNNEISAQPGVPVQGYIFRMLHKNGMWRWMEITGTNLFHEPAIRGVVDNFRDVTDKFEAERRQEFERQDKEALINATDDLIWSVRKDFTLIAANKAFIQSLEDVSGKIIRTGENILLKEASLPEYISFLEVNYGKVLAGESFKEEIFTKIQRNRPNSWLEIRLNPIINDQEIIGIACYGRNITENKQIQLQLSETNKKLETAQEIGRLGYWEYNIKSEELFWSDEVYRILGLDETLFKPSLKFFYSLIHPEDVKKIDVFKEQIIQGFPVAEIEHRILNSKGGMRHLYQKTNLVLDDQGNPVLLEGIMQDVSETKEYIHAIEAQNAKLREIAWMQSHVVRAPLARLMGLVDLLSSKPSELDKIQILEYIQQSAVELDGVIREMVRKTEKI
ncbi:PAS domain S-box protein [Adhaeribacter aquaticus]|uniref:PAS domain S-box protein n=1 Tax=Adhaeribacter aquaticus TaxID=299567 RepID=UPI00040FBD3D|nr:PAS domain S-box protein [Adhaeribacter aquaticus]